jgi:acetyltransferase-like isoleucine patch superfamily enzyme
MIHPTALIGEPPEAREHRYVSLGVEPEVHPTAIVEAYVTVDAGVERPTFVGERAWLMKKVHVGHDAIVMDDCEVAPLASIGGYVELGRGVKAGQGAVFKPRVRVGDGARIGAGAVVTKDVPAGETWVGNPARRLVKGEAAGLEAFDPKIPDSPRDPYEEWGEWWDRTRA